MESIKKDKKIYKRALQIAWPSVLESFFISIAGMIDTIMVSRLGPYAVAAVGLTVQPKFLALIAFFAVNTSISALVARRKGANDRKGANQVFVTAFTLAMVLNLLITIVFLFANSWIIDIAGSQADTHDVAVKYFRIIIGGQIFNVIPMAINAAQRGSGNTKIAFTTNLISSLVNITFNFLLIEGRFGFPELGVQGAAIATVLGTVVATVLSVFSLFKKESLVQVSYIVKNKIKPKMDALKSIFNLGSTIFVENLAMRIGFVATSVIAANLGTDSFAAYNVAMQFLSLSFAFGDGMQVAAVALTGRALGSGDKDMAYKYAHVSQRIGLTMSIILSLIYISLSRVMFGFFFTEEHIIEMGQILMLFIAFILILQVSQIIYGGCLRAGGDVKYTLMASIIAVSIVRTLVTIATVYLFDMGIIGIWLGILADQIVRYVLLRNRFKTGIWTTIKI